MKENIKHHSCAVSLSSTSAAFYLPVLSLHHPLENSDCLIYFFVLAETFEQDLDVKDKKERVNLLLPKVTIDSKSV